MSETLARTLSDTHEDDPPGEEDGWDRNLEIYLDAYAWAWAEAQDALEDHTI